MYVYSKKQLYRQYADNATMRLWLDHLDKGGRTVFDRALDNGDIYVYLEGQTVAVYILLNNAFDARNDTQYVTTNEGFYVLNEVLELYDRYGRDGLIAWTSVTRQVDAVNYGEFYYDAVAYFL